MAQAPFNLAVQRIADASGRLQPPERAVRFLSPFTSVDVPAETLRGASGSGEVTGYTAIGLDTSQLPGIITSRIVTGTAPLRVNGGDSADLGAGNITLTIEPATTLAPGSLSAADKTKLDSVGVGAAISDVLGTSPIVVTPSGSVRTVSILAASGVNPGSLSSAFFNLLTNMFTPTTPTTIFPDAPADPGILATRAAFADHQHGIATAAPGAIAIGDTAAEGIGNDFARATHRHQLDAPTPGETLAVGAANSNGTSPRVARADHVHMHKSVIRCGANALTGTTATRYMTDGFNYGTAPVTTLDAVVGRAFQVTELWTNARVGGTAGQTITATLRKNGAAVGAAFITHASDDTAPASNTFGAVSYSPGDTWGLEVTKSGAIATGPTDIWYVLVISPP